jgi:hypothetical protein
MRRLLAPVLAAAMLVPAASCGPVRVGSPDVSPDFDGRAKQVARAWHDAGLDTAWTTGFVPLDSLTQFDWNMSIMKDSSDVDRAVMLKAAIGNGWYRLTGTLPTDTPATSQVKFADGTAMSVPVVSATDAFAALHNPAAPPVSSCGEPNCALTVTGARLSTTTIRTSRGQATVPAWMFTVSEVTVPAVRVAVAPNAITALPDPDRIWSQAPGFTRLEAVVQQGNPSPPAQARRLTLHFTGGVCAETHTGYVYETPELVVLGVIIRNEPGGDGGCPSAGKYATVGVELSEPLGNRVLLDVATGQPQTLDDCGPSGYRCGRPPTEPPPPTPKPATT